MAQATTLMSVVRQTTAPDIDETIKKEQEKMDIIEKSIIAKNPKEKPEDGIVVTDDFIAVIDGSTSKSPTRISRWKSNGRYCMQLIEKFIKKMPKDITAGDFCQGVTTYVRKHYSQTQISRLQAHPEERLTASCIVFSRLQRQVWMIGDCQCMIGDYYFDNAKPCERQIAQRRADIAHEMLASGRATIEGLRTEDAARQAIIPDLVEAMKGQNVDYAVIDGFPIPMRKVKVETLNFEPWTIVFASDGYPVLKPTLQESEEALRQQQATDPLNIGTFKATKAFMLGNNSFDDRSYIRFKV